MFTGARFRLGIDIGGTFADLTLIEVGRDRVCTHKVQSTPQASSKARCARYPGITGADRARRRRHREFHPRSNHCTQCAAQVPQRAGHAAGDSR